MQPSRRAFLLGRRPRQSSWAAFCERLSLAVAAPLRDLDPSGGAALLLARSDAEVRRARALCQEYGVSLGLPGARQAGRPVLQIDPRGLRALAPEGAAWRAGPGCLAGELAAAGLSQFAEVAPERTLADWLADAHGWPTGETGASGVLEASVLLADGTAEALGPFGAADVRPLRSATVQRLVPALFQLAGGPDAAACLALPAWPARCRLDALQPREPSGVNLAHLLLGHDGALAWVESVLLAPAPAPAPPPAAPGDATAEAARLDARVRALFDPDGVLAARAGAGAVGVQGRE
ncbi:hypothetical protein [Bordetella bronchiseptica]|uniref:hypothetical protein n=1 Tax=Bordetella bronchiseptica TaxID=518 RepID=UPI000FD6CCE7|nr:hypothetical protein [Bordetella bronchiseptica]AZW43213.1 hypothetical protein CWR61_06615 [Bordetella bronchiseptica]